MILLPADNRAVGKPQWFTQSLQYWGGMEDYRQIFFIGVDLVTCCSSLMAEAQERVKWRRLLCPDRLLGASRSASPSRIRGEFLRDCDRIVFSAPFRRLLDKTQCFPLSANDSVHTRLTHSLEVSSVGRTLGRLAGEYLLERKVLSTETDLFDIGDLVAAACLAHDIGNPPFGHSGEDALRDWWHAFLGRHNQACTETKTKDDRSPADIPAAEQYNFGLTSDQLKDLQFFEGNANGFRILVEARPADLTCAVLATYTKYPCKAQEIDKAAGVGYKKNGYYSGDETTFRRIADSCYLEKDGTRYARHPLAFLMEAADDICYSIVDLEDAVRLGHLSKQEVTEAYQKMIDGCPEDIPLRKPDTPKLSEMRSVAIYYAIYSAFMVWKKNYADILAGKFKLSLVKAGRVLDALEELNKRLYALPTIAKIEAAGYKIITGLMEIITNTLTGKWETDQKRPINSYEKCVFLTLPQEEQEKAQKLRECADKCTAKPTASQFYNLVLQAAIYVCGMTDSFAIRYYKELTGESLPF